MVQHHRGCDVTTWMRMKHSQGVFDLKNTLTWLSECRYEVNKKMSLLAMLTIKTLTLCLQQIQSSMSSLSTVCFTLCRSQPAFLSFANLFPPRCCFNTFISLWTNNSINGFGRCSGWYVCEEDVKLSFDWIYKKILFTCYFMSWVKAAVFLTTAT